MLFIFCVICVAHRLRPVRRFLVESGKEKEYTYFTFFYSKRRKQKVCFCVNWRLSGRNEPAFQAGWLCETHVRRQNIEWVGSYGQQDENS